MLSDMNNPRERDEEQRREALAALKSLGESETFATSTVSSYGEAGSGAHSAWSDLSRSPSIFT